MSKQNLGSRSNILIVDDLSANLVSLSEMIQDLGYTPRPVTSVKDAQAAIEKKKPDLILLDITMPDITGFEYCAMLKADVKTREIPIIFISALDATEDKVKGFRLGAVDYISKPFEKEEVRVRISTHLKIHRLQRELESYNGRLHKMINDQARLVEEEQKNTLRAMASLAEKREGTAGRHLEMVAENCRLLSISLQFSPVYEKDVTAAFIDEIEVACQLHDVGYLSVSDALLCKESAFTSKEFVEFRKHAEDGARLLEGIYGESAKNSFMKMAIDIARYHHENWDGSGYPRGLIGEEIPLCARIFKVIDCYDSLNRKCAYREAYSLEESLKIMDGQDGVQFDPSVMKIFRKVQKQLRCENI